MYILGLDKVIFCSWSEHWILIKVHVLHTRRAHLNSVKGSLVQINFYWPWAIVSLDLSSPDLYINCTTFSICSYAVSFLSWFCIQLRIMYWNTVQTSRFLCEWYVNIHCMGQTLCTWTIFMNKTLDPSKHLLINSVIGWSRSWLFRTCIVVFKKFIPKMYKLFSCFNWENASVCTLLPVLCFY